MALETIMSDSRRSASLLDLPRRSSAMAGRILNHIRRTKEQPASPKTDEPSPSSAFDLARCHSTGSGASNSRPNTPTCRSPSFTATRAGGNALPPVPSRDQAEAARLLRELALRSEEAERAAAAWRQQADEMHRLRAERDDLRRQKAELATRAGQLEAELFAVKMGQPTGPSPSPILTNSHNIILPLPNSPCVFSLPPPPPHIQTPQTTGSTPKSTAAAAGSPADTVALQQQRLDSLFKENAQLRDQLTEAQRLAEEWEFAKARVEDEWEDRLNQAQAATGRALGEREQLFAELEQAKEKIASESSAKKKLEESRALFESELRQEIRSKVALLEAEVSRLSVEVKAATNRAEMAEKSLVEAQVRVADMEAREREHAEASAAVAEQHASLLFNMETEIEGAEQRESEARADAERLAAEVSKLKGEMEEMFRAKTDAVSELMLMKGDVERLEKSKQVAEAAALDLRTKLVAAKKLEEKLKRRSQIDVSQKLRDSDDLLKQGDAVLDNSDIETAIQLFGSALESRVAAFGELGEECAVAYFKYGSALFVKSQLEETDDAADGADAAEEEDLEEAEDGDEEEESDQELAWRLLETARCIYAKRESRSLEEVDVISTLADLSLEKEDFDACMEDYQHALHLLSLLVSPHHRRVIELYFKMALANQTGNRASEALRCCRQAIDACEKRVAQAQSLLEAKRKVKTAGKEGGESLVAGGSGAAAAEGASVGVVATKDADEAAEKEVKGEAKGEVKGEEEKKEDEKKEEEKAQEEKKEEEKKEEEKDEAKAGETAKSSVDKGKGKGKAEEGTGIPYDSIDASSSEEELVREIQDVQQIASDLKEKAEELQEMIRLPSVEAMMREQLSAPSLI
ncbi:unnamed protein product [Closterium sp. Yama58-4]|nr:unnamed protein product [Closterium sp. Yama58-4]